MPSPQDSTANQSGTFLRVLGYVQGLSWVIAVLLLMAACPPPKMYWAYVLDVTKIDTKDVKWERTPKQAHIWTSKDLAHNDFYNQVDAYITELSACLQKIGLHKEGIDFNRVFVYVPTNWYTSTFGEQLIPSVVNPELCNVKLKKLGLPPIRKECEWLWVPTKECPNVCNVRAAIVDYYVVAATPNMKLFKAELARLILYKKYGYKYNNPWQAPLNQCL